MSFFEYSTFNQDALMLWESSLASFVVDLGFPTIVSLCSLVSVDRLAVVGDMTSAVLIDVVGARASESMSPHVFLQSSRVFISVGRGYEIYNLNFFMRYMHFRSTS